MKEYLEFLESKKKKAISSGFDVTENDLNPRLKDFQKFIIPKAIKAGKFALFADTGLGKTFMQLEWSRLVSEYTKKPVLILAPLAVVNQTIREANKWGIECELLTPIFFMAEIVDGGIYISNYDQLHNIDTDYLWIVTGKQYRCQ